MSKKKIIFFSTLIIVIVMAITYGAIAVFTRSEKVDNIFSYAIKVSNGEFSHTYLKFFSSKDEVLKNVKTRRKATVKQEEYGNSSVVSEIELTGLSDKVIEKCIIEKCNTGEELLFAVSYFMSVSKDEIDGFLDILYEQAKTHMPLPTEGSLELIKDGELNMLYWIDGDNSQVTLSFSEEYDSDKWNIILQVTCPKNLMKSYFE